jgi:hypothetical protein
MLYSPANAIDGNRSGRSSFNDEVIWHSTQSSHATLGPATQFDPLWFEVNLGADRYLDRVEIFSRLSLNPLTLPNIQWPPTAQHLIQDFRIDVFNMANTNVFSKSYLPSKSTDDEPWATSDMRNIVGSRVRITRDPRHKILGGFANSAMALAEFEVWGQDTPIPQSLAKNGTVTATDPTVLGLLTMPASRAIDGNLSGHIWHEGVYWSNRGTGTGPYMGPFGNGHYWQVELPSLSQIDYVTLYGRTDGEPSAAQITSVPTPPAVAWHGGNPDHMNGPIRISILGADGTTLVTSADTTLGGDDGLGQGMQRYDLTHIFASNPIGKFVRIEALDTTKTLSLGEVEVFGTPQGVGGSVPEPAVGILLVLAAAGPLTFVRRPRRACRRAAGSASNLIISLIAVVYVVGLCEQACAIPTNLSTPVTSIATASSNLTANPPTLARNGDRAGSNFWHSANTPIPDIYGMQHWYEVDLGSNFYLDRLQIFPRSLFQDTIKNFKLEVYNFSGATVFSQMFLPDKTTGDRAWGTTAIRNVVGSRVRIIRDPPHTQWDRAMTFGEFEVWGQATPIPQNLALNRPTTSSTPLTNAGPTGPELANDGNIAGHFWLESVFITDGTAGPYEGPFGNGHFWQTQLAQPSVIDYVRLFARSDDFTNNGMMRVSILAADGTTVVTFADVNFDNTFTGTTAANNVNNNTYDLTQLFPTNPIGSFVRIESLDTTKKLVLAEVEVFGPPAAPVGVPGDYNNNGIVDGADYVVWRKHLGQTFQLQNEVSGTTAGTVTPEDYTAWRTRFGNTSGSGSSLLGGSQVPEPASIVLLGIVAVAASVGSRSRRASTQF